MSQYYTPKKSCYDFGLLAPNRYDMDFLNELLNIHFGKGAAKNQRSKLENKIAYSTIFDTDVPMPRAKQADFFLTSKFDL